MVLAYAPFSWRPLSVLALAAALAIWLVSAPRRALFRGLWFGVGLFGVGISWVYNSLHDFGAAPPLVAGIGTAGLVLIMALFPAVLAWSVAYLRGRGASIGTTALLWFPGALTLLEWGREHFFGGFPWMAPAYTALDTPLAGWAPVAGPAGLNLATALLAGAVTTLVAGPGRRARLVAAGLVLVPPLSGIVLQGREWTEPAGDSIEVAMVQGNVPQDLKWRPEWRQRTLRAYAELTMAAPATGLVLWPETAVPAYLDLLGDYTSALVELVANRGGSLLIGAPTRDSQDRAFNSLVALGADGDAYHKHHLVPFGEYIPLRPLVESLGGLVQIPMSDFSSGPADQPPLSIAGIQIGASICFEVVFPDLVRRQLPQAQLLVNVSNDAWFGDSLAPHQHLEMARMRALETGRYLLRATNNGISAVLAPTGAIVQRSAQFEAQVLTGTATPYQGATPFVRWGQWPALALATVLVALGWRSRWLNC